MAIKVELTVDTDRRVAGVEYARALYNRDNPDNPIETNEAYIMFVAVSAADSWADMAERAVKMKAAGLE